MRRCIALWVLCCLPFVGKAQKTASAVNDQLLYMVDSVAAVCKKAPTVPGYRFMLYNGRSREEATHMKERAYRLAPYTGVYQQYKAPNYHVKLGNYLTRTDALLALPSLEVLFPGLILVPDQVLSQE